MGPSDQLENTIDLNTIGDNFINLDMNIANSEIGGRGIPKKRGRTHFNRS